MRGSPASAEPSSRHHSPAQLHGLEKLLHQGKATTHEPWRHTPIHGWHRGPWPLLQPQFLGRQVRELHYLTKNRKLRYALRSKGENCDPGSYSSSLQWNFCRWCGTLQDIEVKIARLEVEEKRWEDKGLPEQQRVGNCPQAGWNFTPQGQVGAPGDSHCVKTAEKCSLCFLVF